MNSLRSCFFYYYLTTLISTNIKQSNLGLIKNEQYFFLKNFLIILDYVLLMQIPKTKKIGQTLNGPLKRKDKI